MIEIAKHLSGSVKGISSISLCKFFRVVESSKLSITIRCISRLGPDLSLPRLSKLLSKLLIVYHRYRTSMFISLF